MTRFTLHVPRAYNDGREVEPDVLAWIENELVDVAGGFTATEAEGAWRGPRGKLYREPVRLYHVDADEDDASFLHTVADAVALGLKQLAVYLTAQPIETQLREPVLA